ncbi:hypothetical protein D3C77_531330 [compost metagenome]
MVDPQEAYEEYGIELSEMSSFRDLNVVIVAVPHAPFAEMSLEDFNRMYNGQQTKVMIDVKGIYSKAEYEQNGVYYWRL